MKRLIIAMLATAGLVGCADPGPQPATRAQIQASGQMFLDCAYRRARQLDAPNESAVVIAQGIDAACANSWNNYLDTASQGMSVYENLIYRQDAERDGSEDKQAIMMVLRERRGESPLD